MATDDGRQTTDEEGKTRNQVISHYRARRRGSRLSRDMGHPKYGCFGIQSTDASASKVRMLGILRMGILRYAASGMQRTNVACKERMLHAKNACLSGCFSFPHFMKSLINGLGKDGF